MGLATIWEKLKARLSSRNECGEPRKPAAFVFVDYEYWYRSFQRAYWIKPDVTAWLAQIAEQYEITEATLFANFSLPDMTEERQRLAAVSGISFNDTDEMGLYRKDMTDFVMLDAIYQAVDRSPEVEHYILFTGDGHFVSVVNYLIGVKEKHVTVHAIQNSCSQRLIAAASEGDFYPKRAEMMASCMRKIVKNMAYIVDHDEITPTFRTTVDAVSRKYNIPSDLVHATLHQMIADGYAIQTERRIDFRKYIKVISANWEKLIADGIWDPEEDT